MQVSVVCPVYNEEKYIDALITFFLSSSPSDKELFLIDGGSADRTIAIIEDRIKTLPNIRLITNPEKFVSFALNKAIPLCQGDYIVRLDAHTRYAPDYFEKVISTFQETDADIVGGPMRAVGETPFQKAVASATSTSFGIGNSDFHFEEFKGYTDSVYLGAWKRSLFLTTGLFDEQLVRNQDDEFHYRARSKGFKIFQNPEIKSFYYPRGNSSKLFIQYFQYGLFKPLVLRKIHTGARLRHIIPSLFVIYCVLLLPTAFYAGAIAFVPLAVYVLIALVFAVKESSSITQSGRILKAYFLIHAGYGLGFIAGLFKRKRI